MVFTANLHVSLHRVIRKIVPPDLSRSTRATATGEFCSTFATPKAPHIFLACMAGHYFNKRPFPTHLMVAGVVVLAPGAFHTILVRQDGSVWSTGVKIDGRRELSFVQVMPSGATAAAVSNHNSIVLKQSGYVWVTGKSTKERLFFFDQSTSSKRTFSIMQSIPGAYALAAGGYHSMVLTNKGRAWAMGWNKYGQLGDGTNADRRKFSMACSETKAAALGDIHSVVLKHGGSVWATGRNHNGQLGDGSKNDRSRFVKVFSSEAVGVAAGGYHSMVITQDGSLWATGWNEYGQLGDGSTTDRTNYRRILRKGAKAVAGGSRHTIVLKQDGSVWTTGYNMYGQLGDGSTTNSKMFVQITSGGVKVIAAGAVYSVVPKTKVVAAGAFHSMVLKQDGSIWATGSNRDGQFGDGTRTFQKTFVRLSPFGAGTVYDDTHVDPSIGNRAAHDGEFGDRKHIMCRVCFWFLSFENRVPTCVFFCALSPFGNYNTHTSCLCEYDESIRHCCA